MSAPLAVVLDGKIIPFDQPAFMPTERGLLYGDGLFETIPVSEGRAVQAGRHFNRMKNSCKQLGFPEPTAWDESIATCLAAAGPLAGVIRVTWTFGPAASRGYARSAEDGPPRMLVAAFEPAPSRNEGVHAVIVEGLEAGPLARHKTISAMNYVVAASEAHARGADEAILVDKEGYVLEASTANVFVLGKDRTVIPSANRPHFFGIAMRTIRYQYGISDGDITQDELRGADEVFLSNVLAWATPVLSVDGSPIGDGTPGPRTRKVQERHRQWLKGFAQRSS